MAQIAGQVDGLPEAQRALYTPERQELLAAAAEGREWVRNTDTSVLQQLGTLPGTWDKFVKSIAFRPDIIDEGGPGETRVIRLAELSRGNFLGTPIFDIETGQGATKYQYEFGQWRQGPESGAKGLIVVRDANGEPNALMMLFGAKFSLADKAFDMPGGFAEPEDENATNALAHRFITEVREETGWEDLQVRDVTDVGSMLTDMGMTSNAPRLFVGSVDTASAQNVTERDRDNLDPYEITAKAVLIPLDQLTFLVRGDRTDGLFHASLTKAIASPDVPRDVRLALTRALATDLLSDLAVAQSEVQKPREASNLRKIARGIGRALISPATFSMAITKDIDRVSRIIREERSEAGRPYTRGTGVVRSVPRATGRMILQGWRDLGELSHEIARFQPSRPPRRPI